MHNTNSQECILKKFDMLFLTTLYHKFSPLVGLAGTWKALSFPVILFTGVEIPTLFYLPKSHCSTGHFPSSPP